MRWTNMSYCLFFQNHRYSTYESGMIKLDGINTVSIDLSKLKGSHLFGHIKTDELYNELDINHYKFIGNNPTEPLYTNVQVSLGTESDKNITFEYISPVKDSFIRLDTSYYKGIKEIKGNIELDFIGITSTLEYAIEGFWRVDKKSLTQVHDIHQHTGMVPLFKEIIQLSMRKHWKIDWRLKWPEGQVNKTYIVP